MNMRPSTQLLLLASLFMTLGTIAQDSNVFLDRGFWKAKPDLATVQTTISEGNDATALNDNAFDAVVYALLEKADNTVIEYLLSLPGNDLEKRTHDSRTYIFWAAYAGNTTIMEHLLDRGAAIDIRDSHQNTPSTFAASTGQLDTAIYDLFERYGAVLAQEKNGDRANLLLLAAPYMKDEAQMDYFLDKGIALEEMDANGNGIFNYAVRGGNTPFLKQLVSKGIPFKGLNQDGGNAFLFAAQGTRGRQNPIELYQYLKKLGLQVNVVSHDGYTPLHRLALGQKDPDIFEFFIKAGAEVDQKDALGNSPLLNAALRNTLEIVKLLSEKTKNINVANEKGQTALMLALQRNQLEVVDFLVDEGANINVLDASGNTLGYYLVYSFDPNKPEVFEAKLNWAIDHGLSLNTVQGDGNSLLHLAAKANDLELLKFLSAFDIPINAQNEEGLTALHIAAMKAKDGEIMQYLLSQGADPKMETLFGETAHDLATENELLQIQSLELSFLE
jgi:ankyrin repeat protein